MTDSLNPTLPTAPRLRATVAALPGYGSGRPAPGARGAEHAVGLASNESHFDPLPSVLDAVTQVAARLNRYPDFASLELRSAIARHHGVSAEEVAVGTGSVAVLQQIVQAVCDAGDEAVFAWRSFEAYPIVVALAGATAVPVALRADEGHDLDAMAAAVTEHTRLVLLCSPNNPTGVSIGQAELERFLERVPAGVLVVLDEAYTDYDVDAAGRPAVDSLALYRAHPNLCLLRTFSKAHGLAGLRVGYAVAAPAIAEGLRRAAIPFGVSAMAEHAAVASLAAAGELRERVAATVSERTRVLEGIRARGWVSPPSGTNFVWLPAGDRMRERLIAAFAEEGLLVRGYPGDGVRITLADPATNDRILAVLAAPGLRA